MQRGQGVGLPSGEAVARRLAVEPLTADETGLRALGWAGETPLWYYVLKEAEVRADGNSLGELGSRIVCETVIGLLKHDRNSYLNNRGWWWTPADAVRLPNGDPIVTIRDFLRFAGVMA